MKIIYLKNHGGYQRGEVKEVAEGYARNFLFPQGLALVATVENASQLKKESDRRQKNKFEHQSAAQQLAEKISGRKIEIKAKANPAGKLYAAVSEAEVKESLKKIGLNIGEAKIIFSGHLKEAGDYQARVDFGGGIISNINIAVKV